MTAPTCVRWRPASPSGAVARRGRCSQHRQGCRIRSVLLETPGSARRTRDRDHADLSVYVIDTRDGAASQLKRSTCWRTRISSPSQADKQGADDALRESQKAYRRNRNRLRGRRRRASGISTVASDFNDPYQPVLQALVARSGEVRPACGSTGRSRPSPPGGFFGQAACCASGTEPLFAEIVEEIRRYERWAEQAQMAEEAYRLELLSINRDRRTS